jgi:hypothetical protein
VESQKPGLGERGPSNEMHSPVRGLRLAKVEDSVPPSSLRDLSAREKVSVDDTSNISTVAH